MGTVSRWLLVALLALAGPAGAQEVEAESESENESESESESENESKSSGSGFQSDESADHGIEGDQGDRPSDEATEADRAVQPVPSGASESDRARGASRDQADGGGLEIESESEDEPHVPTIVPPRLEEVLVVPYPADAPTGEGSVEVRVRVAIDEHGEHIAAELLEGAGEPFDSLALQAARDMRFAPATVDGEPTVVTVDLPVRFVLPAPPPPPEPAGVLVGKVIEAGTRQVLSGVELTARPADPDAPPPDPPLTTLSDDNGGFRFLAIPVGDWEIVVSGAGIKTTSFDETMEEGLLRQVVYKVMPGDTATRTVVRVRRDEAAGERIVEGEWLRGAAGASGGFLRVLESEAPIQPTPVLPTGLLPGAPLIRGAEGADSLVLVDGVETPLLYHFLALTTVVADHQIDHIKLLPGGGGVETPDHIGGVIDVTRAPPRTDRFGGFLDISPIDGTAAIATPIAPPVSAQLSFRRSFVDLYLGKLLPEDLPVEVSAMPVYADLSAMVDVHPGMGHRAGVSLLSSTDHMELIQSREGAYAPLASLEAGFTIVQGFYRSPPGGPVEGQASVSFENVKSRYAATEDLFLDIHEQRVEVAGGMGIRLSPALRLRYGGHVRRRVLEFGQNFYALPREDEPGLINPFALTPDADGVEQAMTDAGFYVSAPLTPLPGLTMVPGVRADRWNLAPRWTADPRFTVRAELGRRWTTHGAIGIFHQVPATEDLVEGGPGLELLPEGALQASGGAAWRPIPAIQLGLDLYVRELWNLVVADGNLYDEVMQGSWSEDEARPLSNDGIGRAGGAELTFRWRPDSHVDALVAYSLSHSRRRDHEGENWRNFQYDRPHQLTLAGQVRAPHEWSFGLRFRLTSGAPDTPVREVIYLADLGGYVPRWGLPYSDRLRPFHQLDWRVQKVFRARTFLVVVYLDVENTYYATRDDVVIYNRSFSERLSFAMIPLLRLGMRAEF